MVSNTIQSKVTKRTQSLTDYMPLLALISLSILGAIALMTAPFSPEGMVPFMHYFMGLYFLFFSLLKLFDLNRFADGLAMYDLLAKRWKGYGHLYPFIELFLALGFFSFLNPTFIYSVTLALMIFSSVGVLQALKNGVDIYCPCMGNILKVPLSTVTLSENVLMGLMALMLLIGR